MEELHLQKLKIIQKSRLYSSVAFPNADEPSYVNGCLEIEAECRAYDVLTCLKKIELKMGRLDNTRWGSRVCDLDLLTFSDSIFPEKKIFDYWYKMSLEMQIKRKPGNLLLPHPRIQDRAFVLRPLMEVGADWVHPVLKLSVREMFAALSKKERDAVIPI